MRGGRGEEGLVLRGKGRRKDKGGGTVGGVMGWKMRLVNVALYTRQRQAKESPSCCLDSGLCFAPRLDLNLPSFLNPYLPTQGLNFLLTLTWFPYSLHTFVYLTFYLLPSLLDLT